MQNHNDHNRTDHARKQREEDRINCLRIKIGFFSIFKRLKNAVISTLYIGACVGLWYFRERIFPIPENAIAAALQEYVLRFGIPIVGAVFFIFLLMGFGWPLGAARTQRKLGSIGLRNAYGEVPLLVERYRLNIDGISVTVLTFEPRGLTLKAFMDKQADIERVLHHFWVKKPVEDGEFTLLYVVSKRRKVKLNSHDREF